MGQRFMAAFPATNNTNTNVVNMYRSVVESILYKFLPFTFNTVVIDTKNGIPNVYNTDNKYKLGSKFEEKVPRKPIIRFEFNNKGNNSEDTQLGLYNLKRMANTHGFEQEMRGYIPFFKDLFDVCFWYSPAFCKTDLNISIIVNSKDDQMAFMNIIDSNIDQHYGMHFKNLPMGFYLPKDFILTYKEALFKKELEKIREVDFNQKDRDDISQAINEALYEQLVKFSSGYIDGRPILENRNNMIYDLLAYRNVFVKLERFQPDEGEKRNDVYTRFSINSSGFIEFHNIMNYIIDFPTVVNGNFIDEEMFVIKDNEKMTTLTKYFGKRFIHTLEPDPFYNNKENQKRFGQFWSEDSIILENNDVFDFFEEFVDKDMLAFKFAVVYDGMTKQEMNDYIHSAVYRKDKLLERNLDYFNDGTYFSIINPNPAFPYTIVLSIDKYFFASRWKQCLINYIKHLESIDSSNWTELDKLIKEDYESSFNDMDEDINSQNPSKWYDIGNSKIITSLVGHSEKTILNYQGLFEKIVKINKEHKDG